MFQLLSKLLACILKRHSNKLISDCESTLVQVMAWSQQPIIWTNDDLELWPPSGSGISRPTARQTFQWPEQKWPLVCRLHFQIHFVQWKLLFHYLTHWGRATHICVSKLPIIDSDNGLSPGRCQAIIWTNAGILLIGPLGTKFSEILIKIHAFSFKKMHLKMSSVKWRPFCLSLNVLKFHKVCSCESNRYI